MYRYVFVCIYSYMYVYIYISYIFIYIVCDKLVKIISMYIINFWSSSKETVLRCLSKRHDIHEHQWQKNGNLSISFHPIYTLSSTVTLFRYITTLQCGKTHKTLEAGIETRPTSR